MGKKIGVILSGCGFQDGAEVQEAVLTLLALDRAGAEIVCMAPNVAQRQVVDHLTGEPTAESRNVLRESARIARGKIRDLATVGANELDGLVLPGGFGAALNLSDFAVAGVDATVHPEVARLVEEIYAQKKPIGAICIAPAVVARLLGRHKITLTIGNDEGTAAALTKLGCVHQACTTEAAVIDRAHKVVSTPAYMLGPGIKEVAAGIEAAIAAVMQLA